MTAADAAVDGASDRADGAARRPLGVGWRILLLALLAACAMVAAPSGLGLWLRTAR